MSKATANTRWLKLGSSDDPVAIDALFKEAKQLIPALTRQHILNFYAPQEKMLIDLVFNSITEIRLAGPELLLGKLFDEIGFNKIKDELFRHLVIACLCYPVSKFKTTE